MMMSRVKVKLNHCSNAITICINNNSVDDIDPKYNPVSNILDTPLLVAIVIVLHVSIDNIF
jgi:hypothetical protein